MLIGCLESQVQDEAMYHRSFLNYSTKAIQSVHSLIEELAAMQKEQLSYYNEFVQCVFVVCFCFCVCWHCN